VSGAGTSSTADALHGDLSQPMRDTVMQKFRFRSVQLLVATDVAARGLDISNLPYVINYDMPGVPEDYVHRIGRTGRAGVSGIAISLVSPEEKAHLKAIETLLKQKIPKEEVSGYTMGGIVPDFVLLRPNNLSSEKKADKDIKELVEKRKTRKQQTKPSAEKTALKPRTRKKTEKAGGKTSRARTHFQQSSKRSGPRAKR